MRMNVLPLEATTGDTGAEDELDGAAMTTNAFSRNLRILNFDFFWDLFLGKNTFSVHRQFIAVLVMSTFGGSPFMKINGDQQASNNSLGGSIHWCDSADRGDILPEKRARHAYSFRRTDIAA